MHFGVLVVGDSVGWSGGSGEVGDEGGRREGSYACCMLVQGWHGVWVCDLATRSVMLGWMGRNGLCAGVQMNVISLFAHEDISFYSRVVCNG